MRREGRGLACRAGPTERGGKRREGREGRKKSRKRDEEQERGGGGRVTRREG